MVQYIHTPWRDQEELLRVRQQFYPSPLPPSTSAKPGSTTAPTSTLHDEEADGSGVRAALTLALEAEMRQQNAVSRVSMWMQRGGCPHLVESTALLTAAVLSDLHESRTRANSSDYAIRAAYSAAFSRFVTGLLDGQQDKLHKLSMYSIAKTIGLPATFVELRHQATHEQLPSLSKLRSAASNALAWIWNYYWKDLASVTKENPEESGQLDRRRDFLARYLSEEDEMIKMGLEQQLHAWGEEPLLHMLAGIAESSAKPQIILRALQFSRRILDGGFESPSAVVSGTVRSPASMRDMGAIRAELQASNEELEHNTQVGRVDQPSEVPDEASSQSGGWTRYQGTWVPKPIGVV
ncbi:Las1-like-domain-containing protein [Xylaria nigripes]|nr:Las1-like-domain-containing protein [Xylaria nigripes]